MADTSHSINIKGIRTVGEFFFTVQEIEDCLQRADSLIQEVPKYLAQLAIDHEEANVPLIDEWIEFFNENPKSVYGGQGQISDMYINSDDAPDYEELEDFLMGLEAKAKGKDYS